MPAAYPEGGYEPVYSNRSYGLPAPAAPECAGLLEDTAVELVATLFPERAALPRAERPPEPPGYRLEPWARPSAEGFAPPATVTPPG